MNVVMQINRGPELCMLASCPQLQTSVVGGLAWCAHTGNEEGVQQGEDPCEAPFFCTTVSVSVVSVCGFLAELFLLGFSGTVLTYAQLALSGFVYSL